MPWALFWGPSQTPPIREDLTHLLPHYSKILLLGPLLHSVHKVLIEHLLVPGPMVKYIAVSKADLVSDIWQRE